MGCRTAYHPSKHDEGLHTLQSICQCWECVGPPSMDAQTFLQSAAVLTGIRCWGHLMGRSRCILQHRRSRLHMGSTRPGYFIADLSGRKIADDSSAGQKSTIPCKAPWVALFKTGPCHRRIVAAMLTSRFYGNCRSHLVRPERVKLLPSLHRAAVTHCCQPQTTPHAASLYYERREESSGNTEGDSMSI